MAGKMISIVRINLRECSQSYLPTYTYTPASSELIGDTSSIFTDS